MTFLENSERSNETLNNSPKLILNDTSIEIVSTTSEDLLAYVNDASEKFITGELDIEEDWDEYISDLNDLGYTIIERIWNNAWIEQNK
ncbi:hypothetical protein [Mariniplasma anaerobium]|uniref:Uncharacterized protein n=1 Tax=Mariniplasma anaerobium TaxID=2735436 RepID=A0A7U9TJC5_9MOLU|nr:hypothetical protein [Mariniplasma anaerobium]BCR35240.1 hypothetical protein MPAN_001330 [Mariniplasma anaerobium]